MNLYYIDVFLYLRSEGFIEFDIANIVESWDQGSPNHGLVVRATNENVDGTVIKFYSDHDSGVPAQNAYIDVTCN